MSIIFDLDQQPVTQKKYIAPFILPSLQLVEFNTSSSSYIDACEHNVPLLSTRVFMCTSNPATPTHEDYVWQDASISTAFTSGSWKLRFIISIPSAVMDKTEVLNNIFTDDYFKLEIVDANTDMHESQSFSMSSFSIPVTPAPISGAAAAQPARGAVSLASTGLIRIPGTDIPVTPPGGQLNLFLGQWENLDSDDYSRVDMSDLCGEVTIGLDMDQKSCTFLVGNRQTYVIVTHLPEKVAINLSARFPALTVRLVEVSHVNPLNPIIVADPAAIPIPFYPDA